MKKFLASLLAFSMLFGTMGSLSVMAEETDATTEETTIVYGLDNLNDEEGEIKVAFLGGSITQGAGASTTADRYSSRLVNDWFKEKFPNKTVTEVNAGIGGTPSYYGVYRVGRGVLEAAPDVVFVEFAVNDTNYAGTEQGRSEIRSNMEGIVRQLINAPKVPVIIFLYTYAADKAENRALAIEAHEKVAKYYGIPSININEYMTEQVAGGLQWQPTYSAADDGTHPNSAGYKLYSDYIGSKFDENYNKYFKNPRIRQIPLEQAYVYGAPTTISHSNERIEYTGTWTESTELDYLQAGLTPDYSWAQRPAGINDTFIQTSEIGAAATLAFEGRSIGLAPISTHNGGTMEYVVDEGTENEIKGTVELVSTNPGYTSFLPISTTLSEGEHTIKLTNVSTDEANARVSFSHILIDEVIPTWDENADEGYNYDDYIVGDMPESIMKWAAAGETEANRSGERGWMSGSRNCRAIDTDPNFDGNVIKTDWGTAGSYSPRAIYTLAAITGDVATEEGDAYGHSTVGGDGMASNVYVAYDPNRTVNYFKMDNSKNYVFKLYIKDNYPGVGEAPLVNFAVSNDNVAGRAWSKEYGAEGFRVTGEFEAYAGTFDLPDTFNNDGKQTLSSGFIIGNGAGESISYKTSNLGDIYFAEEVAYDIENEKTSQETGLFAGDSATFEAKILNQIGSEGYLDQNFTWLVMDEARTSEVLGFTVTTDATTKNATVTVGAGVPRGTYAVVAYSEKYDMAMGQNIKVYDENYYKNYIVDTTNDNLLGYYDLSAEREFRNKTTRNSGLVDTDTTVTEVWGNSNCNNLRSMSVISELTSLPNVGLAGLAFCPWKPSQPIEWFQLNKNKNYVFKLDIKDNYPDQTPAHINVNLSNESAATATWSKEYGADGFYLTGDYETYGFTFKVHENFNVDSNNAFTIGFLADNAVGESFSVDTSEPGKVYLAEEKAYDIEIEKVSGPEKLQTGNSVTFETKLVNQIGSEGYLTQDFDWYVMDTERSEFIDGFAIDVDATTKKATVTPGETVPTGRYDVVAVSDKYGMAKGQTIRVIADDYYNDYQVKTAPENIYETIYGENIVNGIMQRNTGSVNVNKDNAPVYNFFASADLSYGAYNGINGWITNKHIIDAATNNTESYNKFEIGKSYLFKVRAKDASTNGEAAAINALIHNETSAGSSHNWPIEKPSHSDGYVLTDEYADYIFTIPVGTNFDVSAARHFLTFGFAGGTLSGAAFDIDFSVDDAIYLAEEVVYNIKNTVKAGQTSLKAGETVTLEASVVNQLDKEGTLGQNFTWVAMDTNRKNIIEGITVTPNADTTEATVTVADTVAVGTYTIVAVSEDYDIAKGININVATAAEKISSFELIEDGGYVMLNAEVVDSTAEKIFFVLAAYAGNALSVVKSLPVDVVDGVASVSDMYFDDALTSGTTVKAFIWNYGTQDAIDNPNNFATSLIVK